jgi:hypothetical protein
MVIVSKKELFLREYEIESGLKSTPAITELGRCGRQLPVRIPSSLCCEDHALESFCLILEV